MPGMELCGQHGMGGAAFYKWRAKDGMDGRVRGLERKKRPSERMDADYTSDTIFPAAGVCHSLDLDLQL